MKNDKEIVEFFSKYSDKLLPTNQEEFMKKLKENIDLLPVPSNFDKMEPEAYREYCHWLMKKMKFDYKKIKKNLKITCVFASAIVSALILFAYSVGAFSNGHEITIIILLVIVSIMFVFTYSMIPSLLRN